MAFLEIVVEVAQDEAERLSDALMEEGALSVSVEDADLGTPDEQPLFGEPGMEPHSTAWAHSRVVALLDGSQDPAQLLGQACAALELNALPSYQVRQVEDQDWVRLTQAQFDPIHIGKRIWVVPSWHAAPAEAGLILELDPGLAFGTGSHPTTRLCMEWLETHLDADSRVLDYGCGSGILAMTAAKLGAHSVLGVDIDPQAIEAARFNAERNRCHIDYYLPEAFASACPSNMQFDLVVANILSNPLKLLAPLLSGRVAPGGQLVLSGVLARQADEVIAAYAPFLSLAVWAEQEGWVALAGRRTATPS